MSNIERLARPILTRHIVAATVEIHRVVEGFARDPVELCGGVWLLCLRRS